MIPPTEIALLSRTVDRATDMARSGRLVDAYDELASGRDRAVTLRDEALERGRHADWMPELVKRWRKALELFCAMHGVPIHDRNSSGDDPA